MKKKKEAKEGQCTPVEESTITENWASTVLKTLNVRTLPLSGKEEKAEILQTTPIGLRSEKLNYSLRAWSRLRSIKEDDNSRAAKVI